MLKPVQSAIFSFPYFSWFISPGGCALSANFDGLGGFRNHFNRSGRWIGGSWAMFGTDLPHPSFSSCPFQFFDCNFAIHFSASLKTIWYLLRQNRHLLSATKCDKCAISFFSFFLFASWIHYFDRSQRTKRAKLLLKIVFCHNWMNWSDENIRRVWITLEINN